MLHSKDFLPAFVILRAMILWSGSLNGFVIFRTPWSVLVKEFIRPTLHCSQGAYEKELVDWCIFLFWGFDGEDVLFFCEMGNVMINAAPFPGWLWQTIEPFNVPVTRL